MEDLVEFWKNKKIFLTGHTGFKGSWLTLWLKQLGAELTGFALSPPTETNLFTEANVKQDITDLRGDIRNFDDLKNAMQLSQPEIIIHLAAQPLVRYSYDNPIETYASNVTGTVNLLESARSCSSVKVVLNVTTDKCYENISKESGYKESDALGGFDPYSSSKACSELITAAYRNSFYNPKIELASARAGNVIGGGDWSTDRLLPDLILACLDNKPLTIRYPEAVRPWQHVLDSLSGYLKLIQMLYENPQQFNQAWNFGPLDKQSKTVEWIANQVLDLWGSQIQFLKDESVVRHEANHLTLDIAKANKFLEWKPKWDIQKTLQETVHWYKNFYQRNNAREITLSQINAYQHSLP